MKESFVINSDVALGTVLLVPDSLRKNDIPKHPGHPAKTCPSSGLFVWRTKRSFVRVSVEFLFV